MVAWRRIASETPRYLPYALLAVMVLGHFIGFSATVLNEFNRFWYGNFDLGIPDQGMWLLSRFHNPYLTTRGLHLFGDHASYIHLLVAPLYWIWNDVKALLLLHTAVLAIGAVPVYLLAKDRFGDRWTPLVFSLSYLMLPALHYSNLDQGYHYESFMVPLMLFGHWLLTRKKTRLYYGTVFLSLICKEEIALTYILYGLYVALKHDRRAGLTTSVVSLVYLLAVMTVLLPAFNQEGAFYSGRTLGSYGDTMGEKIRSLTNPYFMEDKINTPVNRRYVKEVLAPVGYLPVLEPLAIASSGSLWLNLLQDWPYAHHIQYHYVTPIIPMIYIALIAGVGRFKNNLWLKQVLLFTVLASAVIGNYLYAPDQSSLRDPGRMLEEVRNFDRVSDENREILELMESIPDDASVSASYDFVSHLSHRITIYMFPNPFRVNLYGIDDKGVHPDRRVDYVLLDARLTDEEEREHGTVSMVRDEYELVDGRGYAQLWKRKSE